MLQKIIRVAETCMLATIAVTSLFSTALAGPPPPPDIAPVISGTPASTDTAGTYYSFTPSASDADSNNLTFSIQNKPSWAYFNTSNGTLSGTPTAGTYNNIQISVSDGTLTTSLSPFTINVAASGGSGGSGTPVPVMDGIWLLPGLLAGFGLISRRRKR